MWQNYLDELAAVFNRREEAMTDPQGPTQEQINEAIDRALQDTHRMTMRQSEADAIILAKAYRHLRAENDELRIKERSQRERSKEAEIACRHAQAHLAELESLVLRVREALEMLYCEIADYIKINNLGDVHHNQSMKLAREALALVDSRGGKRPPKPWQKNFIEAL